MLQDLLSHFKIGTGYHCTVLNVDEQHKSLNLSLSGNKLMENVSDTRKYTCYGVVMVECIIIKRKRIKYEKVYVLWSS